MAGFEQQSNYESSEYNENQENERDAINKIAKAGNGDIENAVNYINSNSFPKLKEGSSDIAKQFLTSIENQKNNIMKLYPNITNNEYNEIAKRAIGILYQESNAGNSMRYQGKEGVYSSLPAGIRGTMESIRGEEFSRGYTQIKYNKIFNENDRNNLKVFGINNGDSLSNPKNCGIATMVGLISNYNRFILPMKNDRFRTNDAEIIKVKFTDGKTEYFARGKAIMQPNGAVRARTEQEIQSTIKMWADKHGKGTPTQEVITRPGIKSQNTFFDLLYYARNKPSEIEYGTATPDKNEYVRNCRAFISSNIENSYNIGLGGVQTIHKKVKHT